MCKYSTEKKLVDDAILRARHQLSQSDVDTAWATGAAMTLDEAVAYALACQPTGDPLSG